MGGINFDDLQWEKRYNPTRAYSQSKAANLMFALELDRRSERAGWGIVSNAAHPGFAKTNLQLSSPSQGKESPTLLERFYRLSRQVTPFMWQEVDDGILPVLYAATSPRRPKAARSMVRVASMSSPGAGSPTPRSQHTRPARPPPAGCGRPPGN